MKKLLKRIWNADERIWVYLSLFFFSVFLMFEYYTMSLTAFLRGLKDFGTSVGFWFCFSFEKPLAKIFGHAPTVYASFTDLSELSLAELIDLERIQAKLLAFPKGFCHMFGDYNLWLFDKIYQLSFALLIFSPFIFLMMVMLKGNAVVENDRPNGEFSKAARAVLFVIEKIVLPCVRSCSSFLNFVVKHKAMAYLLIVVWLLNLNVLTLVLDVFAFYFYFIASFRFSAFLMLLAKVLLDALLLLMLMSVFYWLAAAAWIWYRCRENEALDELKHMESKNCGFLKTLDIVTLIIGEPGKGKTTLLTDMVLSWVNIFKTEALKILYRYEMMFPGFAFSKYREDLIGKIQNHEIFCLPQVNDMADAVFAEYEQTKNRDLLCGYKADIFPMSVDLGNRDISLQKALKTYGRAFLVYYNNNPSLSNFPIRFDGSFDDSERMKLWDGDFFKRKKESRYSRILNQDMLRFGKKMDPSSPYNGAFGYGIYSHTELAKSVGNQNTNAEYKTEDEKCNPKNDKHSYSFMMGRHPYSTIDNFVFFRYIGDEQRASSLMAEELGLMSVLAIGSKGDLEVTLKGFEWLFQLRDWLDSEFSKFYWKRENARGDVTLSMLLLKCAVRAVKLSCERLENRFGYRKVELIKQSGSAFSGNSGTVSTAGSAESFTYYQMYMKTYSDRFMTDCYSKLFGEAQKACGMGIMDMKEYGCLDMTVEEMQAQNDHFMIRLMKMLHGSEELEGAPVEVAPSPKNQFEFDEF